MDQAGPENRPRALFKLIEEACLDDEAVIVIIEVGAYIPISCRDVDCSASGDAEIDTQFTFVGGSVEPVCEALRAARTAWVVGVQNTSISFTITVTVYALCATIEGS